MADFKNKTMATSTSTRTIRPFTLTSFKAATDEYFKKVIDSDVELINVGNLPIFHKVLSENGVMENLRTAFGKEDADLIFSLASCLVETGEVSFPFFDGWKANRYLPFIAPLDNQGYEDILKKAVITGKEAKQFFTLRANRPEDEPAIVYASTFQDNQLLWPSFRLTSHYAKTAERGLLTAIGSESGMPTLLHPFPGLTEDFRTFLGYLVAIKEIGVRKINNVVLGPEFYSEVALLRATQAHAKCVFILPKATKMYDRFLPYVLEKFEGLNQVFNFKDPAKKGPIFTTTYSFHFPCQGHDVPVWVHFFDNAARTHFDYRGIFRDLAAFERLWESQPDLRPVLETEPLMKYFSIAESQQNGETVLKLRRDDTPIQRYLLLNRVMGAVTTWEFSADECLEEIGVISKVSDMVNTALENSLAMETPTRESSDGLLFLSFIGQMIKEGLRKNIVKTGKIKAPPERDLTRLDTVLTDPDRIIGAMDGFSYLRRKASKTFVPLLPNAKQKKAVELCGMDGILDTVYQY